MPTHAHSTAIGQPGALEQAGFDFTATSGHVLAQPPGTHLHRPARQYAGPFYDPLVALASLAATTSRLRFITAILILPAWPAAIVAKQAAELALFSGGRFELGVGISGTRPNTARSARILPRADAGSRNSWR